MLVFFITPIWKKYNYFYFQGSTFLTNKKIVMICSSDSIYISTLNNRAHIWISILVLSNLQNELLLWVIIKIFQKFTPNLCIDYMENSILLNLTENSHFLNFISSLIRLLLLIPGNKNIKNYFCYTLLISMHSQSAVVHNITWKLIFSDRHWMYSKAMYCA